MVFDTLQQVVGKLETLGIPYMLTGSVAMTFYTVTRNTQDIDFVILLKTDQVDKMEELFAGDYFNKKTVFEEIKLNGMFNVILNSQGFKIDFILLKNDAYSTLAFSRKQLITKGENSVFVCAIEDLIIAKIKWIQVLFSERQIRDIQNLMMGNELNLDYVKFWINELKLDTFGLFEHA